MLKFVSEIEIAIEEDRVGHPEIRNGIFAADFDEASIGRRDSI